jgi:hypothetical protein
MASSAYYRRQSELCLQLALLQAELNADLRMTFWLLELAKELRAKAGEAENVPGATSAGASTHMTCLVAQSPDHGTKLH